MIHHSDDWLTIHGGDAREVMRTLPAASVHCVVTSPPYWGLRDYGQDGQLGLEATPEEYVANLVAVFREVRRVLRDDGTVWLNLGDSYAASVVGAEARTRAGFNERYGRSVGADKQRETAELHGSIDRTGHGLKPKDLVGIPWRVAFALQADGWWLRSDIIWSKPNPMPESVTDRPTKAHEYLFLLSKSARYYFDADAVREAATGHDPGSLGVHEANKFDRSNGNTNGLGKSSLHTLAAGRNLRSVWTIATRPYPGAHFAVFPPELPERCIKAGTSERGVCPECGAPWERVVESTKTDEMAVLRAKHLQSGKSTLSHSYTGHGAWSENGSQRWTTGWQPSCDHVGGPVPVGESSAPLWLPPVPAVVLDPFAGSGTVGMVANRLSRRAILIDLNPEYLRQQMKRNAQVPAGL